MYYWIKLTQQEDFTQFARNFRATIKNNTQHTYYMVARKFRASCVKSSCREVLKNNILFSTYFNLNLKLGDQIDFY